MNNECLVKPNESFPKLIKRIINIKFKIVISKANFSDIDFLYKEERFILFIILLQKVYKHKRRIIDEFENVRKLILEN